MNAKYFKPFALAAIYTLVACSKATVDGTPGPSAGPLVTPPASTEGSGIALAGRDALLAAGRLRVEAVTTGPFATNAELEVPGTFVAAPNGTAEVGAVVAGRATQVLVEEGDRVEKGALLARIDAPEAARAAADLVRATARISPLEKRLARYEALAQEQAAVPMQVDDLRGELAAARADAAAARTLLGAFGADGNGAVVLRAPFAGIVASRALPLGGAVAPEKTLFTLLADDALVVAARWPERGPAPPAVGARARLRPASGIDASCTGQVRAVLPTVDPVLRTRTVRIALGADKCSFSLLGSEVSVAFPTATPENAKNVQPAALARTIPRSAVVDLRGATTVFLERGDRYYPRAVRLGVGTPSRVVVAEGLVDGDRVVTEGAVLLKGELSRDDLTEGGPALTGAK
jgi:cobalt-zinc-cadmium efflux system membrane fusion protein